MSRKRRLLVSLLSDAEEAVRSHPRAYAAFYAVIRRSGVGLALASALKRSARRQARSRVVAVPPPDDPLVTRRRRAAVEARLGPELGPEP